MPSAEECYNELFPNARLSSKNYYQKNIGLAMQAFASLAIENERQKWELKNEILLAQVKTLETIIEFQKLQKRK